MKTSLLPPARVDVLSCGLTVARVRTAKPLVATALAYRTGARDDPEGHAGSAHFLEHLMFRGTERFGPGAIDHTTRRLGGVDNAWTSHDTTLYHFAFAADRWKIALEMEADRMRGLLLDPDAVDAERKIVLEEISMYEAEPWDVLEHAVLERHFGGHPYGRPVLGTREDLAATGPEEMRRFHQRWMRPENAVLALAGEVDVPEGGDDPLLEQLNELFSVWPEIVPQTTPRRSSPERGGSREQVVVAMGEVPRVLMVLPGPAASEETDVVDLKLALGILCVGRASRLQRRLVDDEASCVWVSAEAATMVEPGCITLAAELHEGHELEDVEAVLRGELERAARGDFEEVELDRVRRVLSADWMFGHERVDQLASLWASTLAWTDAGAPGRFLARLQEATIDDVRSAAAKWLDAEPVVGHAGPGVR